jgi:HSP20 family protein
MAQLLPESSKPAPHSWKKALERLREDIHDALDRWLHRRAPNGDGGVPVRVSGGVNGGDGRASFPAVFTEGGPPIDVEDNGDELVLLAEMPGLNPKDFAVEILADRVILRGQKKLEVEERRQGFFVAERQFGSFVRVIPLPSRIDVQKAKANYHNGLLRVVLPKTEDSKAKQVQVRVK